MVFTNNGIDAVDHDGRERILAEAHRVLGADGIFCYSTLNKDGPLFGAHPGNAPGITWQIGSLLPASGRRTPWPRTGDGERTRGCGHAELAAAAAAHFRDEGEWGIAPFAAHEFGLVTHFVTLAGARAELDRPRIRPRGGRAVRRPVTLGPGRGDDGHVLPPGGPPALSVTRSAVVEPAAVGRSADGDDRVDPTGRADRSPTAPGCVGTPGEGSHRRADLYARARRRVRLPPRAPDRRRPHGAAHQLRTGRRPALPPRLGGQPEPPGGQRDGCRCA